MMPSISSKSKSKSKSLSAWPLGLLLGSVLISNADSFDFNGSVFHTAPGFEVEIVAGPPITERPICAVFDDQGRLYVAESSGSNAPVTQQLEERPHSILRLEDTDNDGVFDRRVVFADRMMFPEGVLWVNGSLLVSAPPAIWKLTDTDDDGVADVREEWLTQTLTGCANDLHGPYQGRDGLIYWCKGAFAEQTYDRPNGQAPWTTSASHIFRRKFEGGFIEPVMTGGMDNPVEVAFSPEGERFFTTTFLQHPGGGKRDGVIHALYGGVYGKQHGVLEGHPRTGDLLQPVAHLGAAAPSGLAIQESNSWGGDFQNSLYASLFNMRKIIRLPLKPDGASFSTEPEDFFVGESQDFHPTDVLEDADGSILVVDTGGWYKICCPTSQLYKPDVPGAIYRISRISAPKVSDPRGEKLNWTSCDPENFIPLLQDDRPKVRDRAIRKLAELGENAVPALSSLGSPKPTLEALGRLNAVWTLTRIETNAARQAVKLALADSSPSVRQAALHSIGLHRDKQALAETLLALNDDKSAAVQRAAAEALGRIGSPDAIPAIMQTLTQLDDEVAFDRALDHSLIYALIEINAPEKILPFQEHKNPHVRRAVWTTLPQLKGEQPDLHRLFADLAADSSLLRKAARAAILQSETAGSQFGAWLETHHPVQSEADWTPYSELLTRFHQDPKVFNWTTHQLQRQSELTSSNNLTSLTALIRQMKMGHAPTSWIEAILAGANHPKSAWDRRLIWLELLQELNFDANPVTFSSFIPLLKAAQSESTPTEARVAAWSALKSFSISPSERDTQWLVSLLDAKNQQTPLIRAKALDTLKKFSGHAETLNQTVQSLSGAGPIEVSRILEIIQSNPSQELGSQILTALKQNPSAASLSSAMILGALGNFPEPIRASAENWLATLAPDESDQQEKLAEWLERLQQHPGDVRRGQAVFNGVKAACYYCHEIGYLGGDLGPDLTRIGASRSERDLLEAILFPSASFVRSYEPYFVETDIGELTLGILKEQTSEVVRMATAPGLIVEIPRAEITDLRPAETSLMPAGLDSLLTPQELSDLIAFLRASK